LACRLAPNQSAYNTCAWVKAHRKRPAFFHCGLSPAPGQQGDNAAGTFIHRRAHIFGKIAHFSRQFYRQASADNALLTELVQRFLIVVQNTIPVVTFALAKWVARR
jgi:hypothetical protein